MDQIPYIITKGEAYYGMGEVRDFSIHNGHIVGSVEAGNYDNDVLTEEQVGQLIQIAVAHQRVNMDNDVVIYEFQYSEESGQTGWPDGRGAEYIAR